MNLNSARQANLARVAAVVTSYRPGPELLRNIEAVLPQVDLTIIVDDCSGAGSAGLLQLAERAGAVVERSPENRGIAAAANLGIDLAADEAVGYVLLLDQDSRCPEQFVQELVTAYEQAVSHGHTPGFVVPEYFGQTRQAGRRLADGTLLASKVIQSGMLVPLESFGTLGPLDAGYFIDLVDTEFELRCRTAGRPPIAAPGISLAHSLGVLRVRPGGTFWRWFGVAGTHSVSQPFRYYYRIRNRRSLNRTYFSRLPWRIIRDSCTDAAHYLILLMETRSPQSLFRIYCVGWRDGRRGGPRGRMPHRLETVAGSVTWRSSVAREHTELGGE